MPPVAKNKKGDSIIEIENTRVDFNTSNYLNEIINTYDSGRKSDFQILVIMTHRALTF